MQFLTELKSIPTILKEMPSPILPIPPQEIDQKILEKDNEISHLRQQLQERDLQLDQARTKILELEKKLNEYTKSIENLKEDISAKHLVDNNRNFIQRSTEEKKEILKEEQKETGGLDNDFEFEDQQHQEIGYGLPQNTIIQKEENKKEDIVPHSHNSQTSKQFF